MDSNNFRDHDSIVNRGWPVRPRTPIRESIWDRPSIDSTHARSGQQASFASQNNAAHQGSVHTNTLIAPQRQFFTTQTDSSGPLSSVMGGSIGATSRPHNPFDIHHPANRRSSPWTNPFTARYQSAIDRSTPTQLGGPTMGFGSAGHSSSFPGQTSVPRSSWRPHVQAAFDRLEDEISTINTTHGYSGGRGLTARETIEGVKMAMRSLQRQHPGSLYDYQLVQRGPDGGQVPLQNVGESHAPIATQDQEQSRSGAGSIRRTRRGRGGWKKQGGQDYRGIKKQKNKKNQRETPQFLPKNKTEPSQDQDLRPVKKEESESEGE